MYTSDNFFLAPLPPAPLNGSADINNGTIDGRVWSDFLMGLFTPDVELLTFRDKIWDPFKTKKFQEMILH